ncbi:MAG: pentapeptide repeat-containing protein [Actinomycetia bacterium]|nr:pentapeptide repeat-containing protein [Actinomycetes bacterium]
MPLAGLELRGADFTEANLGGANLTATKLNYQNKTPEAPGQPEIPAANTFLQGVNLCRADLTAADLRGAYLVNANLTGADLTSTKLQGAALNGSDLSGATMPADASFLDRIYYDDNTIWPEGFQPPPSNAGPKIEFLQNPIIKELYGDVQRPTCNS